MGPDPKVSHQKVPPPKTPGLCKSMVGVRGFEPPTPCSRSRCATRLRYSPNRQCYRRGGRATQGARGAAFAAPPAGALNYRLALLYAAGLIFSASGKKGEATC